MTSTPSIGTPATRDTGSIRPLDDKDISERRIGALLDGVDNYTAGFEIVLIRMS
jgi:hypothetical protein